MEQVGIAIRYAVEHPALAVGATIVLALLFYLLNRKPRMTREAENRVKQIRKERGDQYHKLRPPR
ncbi:MAG: hypothetical protein U0587_14465 [Candidatus Binatia bacterium]